MGKSIRSKYFCGNEISAYGLENGRVDYRTLAKAFDAVLNNEIISKTQDIGYWDIDNGNFVYYENENGEIISEGEYWELEADEQEKCTGEYYNEIYQYYIISDSGAEILRDWTDEIVFYNSKLDMYVWGVTHYGTSWDYVLTDIKIEK